LKTPVTTRKPRNPQGRVDVLIGRLIEEGLKHIEHPVARTVAQELHDEIKGDLAVELRRAIGPRTKNGKTIQRIVERGSRMIEKARKASRPQAVQGGGGR
jgi:hypothetical protein